MYFFSALIIILKLFCEVYSMRFSLDPMCKPPRGNACVDIYDCPYFGNLLAKSGIPKPHHIIKEIRKRQCGFVGKNPAVCCPDSGNELKNDIEEPNLNLNSLFEHRNIQLLPTANCGKVGLDSRITNGKQTELGEFPWVALIVYNTDNGPDFLCGGTLINERYVLTAAHCILKNIIGVRLGEYNIITLKDCDEGNSYCAPPVQDFYIESVEVHSQYDKVTDFNDIALIRLAQPANLTNENILPICLPVWNVHVEEKKMIVAGWGMTETGFKSSILKKAVLPIVPLEQCQKIYEGQANITSNQICAGGKKEDSCNGDSGGPLSMVVHVKETYRHVQYGIVSYGPKQCGTLGMPGIYTRIEPYVKWILDTIH